MKLVDGFAAIAREKNCTPSQLALAWVLAQGDDIIPIPGTRRVKYLEENAASVDVNLSSDDLKRIEELLEKYPDVGQRYSEGALKLVNR